MICARKLLESVQHTPKARTSKLGQTKFRGNSFLQYAPIRHFASARKGWLTPGNVLNTRSADEVLAFARARRERAGTMPPHLRVMQG
jgi:hypothetical protein